MTLDLNRLKEQLAGKNPRVILKTAFEQFDNIALSFSGAEDVVLVDMATKIKAGIRVFTLDTGRLHGEPTDSLKRCGSVIRSSWMFYRRIGSNSSNWFAKKACSASTGTVMRNAAGFAKSSPYAVK